MLEVRTDALANYRHVLSPQHALCTAADGEEIIGVDSTVRLWDIRTLRPRCKQQLREVETPQQSFVRANLSYCLFTAASSLFIFGMLHFRMAIPS